jgi:hypothetical protein
MKLGFSTTLTFPASVIVAFTLIAGCTLTDSKVTVKRQPRPISESHFLKQIADIPLSGDSSRFDYQSIDEQIRRLYIAHLGAGQVTVFDTRARKIVAGFCLGLAVMYGTDLFVNV